MFNPYVREGDEIIVPFEFDNYPTIQIAGEVNRPITVPYKEGDFASLLLKLGYGLTPKADLNNILLYTGDQKINILSDTAGNLQQPDFEIASGSILVVGAKDLKEKSKISTVSITGEVIRPGVYVIENEKTRLRDLVDMAGGFTKNAHLPLANVFRYDRNAEYKMDIKKDYNESFQYSNLTLEDTTRFMIDMQYSKNNVSCDFDRLFNYNDNKYNVVLRGGDIINIPEQPHQVYVYGQVTNPGYIEFVPGKTLEYYVEKAGGYADGAEKVRARIIRGRNLIWDKPSEKVFVNAGDQIYVPRKPDIPAWLEIQRYSVYAALIGTAATVVNILYGIYLNSKK
jgi:protein involved in polysaccharide export with SLBB domain